MEAVRAEQLEPALVTEMLDEGDVLFVDTSHTVKTGGDVDHICSAIIPRLAPGVWVHVHDVFLPYEYPRQWVVDHLRLRPCLLIWLKWRAVARPPGATTEEIR